MALKNPFKTLFRPKGTVASRGEYGSTGSLIFSGLPMEEYNSKLAFPKSTKVYDEMRRSDGQVAAIIAAVTLPIISTQWTIQPDGDADDSNLAEEIADFISDNLFGGMKYSWADHLREALLYFVYGFSVFEKVFSIDTYNGRQVIVLDKLAPRVARSIWRFPQDQNNNIRAVQQIDWMNGKITDIPLDKCLVYTYQREGDNIVGISGLRPGYKHWWIKSELEKIIAIGVEKALLSTPYAQVPKGTSDEETDKLLSIITNLRTAQEAGGTIPDDVELKTLDLTGSSGIQNLAMAYLEYHNTQMSKSVLAQFIDLGTLSSASGGSYALGQTMVDLFCMGLESMANYIQGEVQKIIEDLVRWNFGDDAPVPTLEHKKITFADMSQAAQALYWLGAGHLVTTDESMEDYIRDLFGIPPIPRDALDNKLDLPQDRYNPDTVPDDKLTPEEQALVAQRNAAASGGAGNSSDGSDGGSASAAMNEGKGNSMTFADDTPGLPQTTNGEIPAQPKKWRRDLAPIEQNVQWDEIQQNWTNAEKQLQSQLQETMRQSANQYVVQVQKILDDPNMNQAQKINAINALEAPLSAKYQQVIQQQVQEYYAMGQAQSAQELGADVQDIKTPVSDAAALRAKATQLALLQLRKMSFSINTVATSQLSRNVPPKQIIHSVKAASEAYITGPDLKTAANITVAESINVGRASAAKQIGIQGAYWSALLDSHTCPLCEELDGKSISVDDPDFDLFRAPLHTGCRCIQVWIGDGEKDVQFNWERPSYSLVKKYGNLMAI
ncbi:phage portal protein family protein [Alicyclobacillus acidoterrestris]|uniref:phage portal protein family protein n=1 Tax=Alicyclobacillus acidoterrestris TaxID=1450 RepID=UPI003F52B8C4